MTPIHAAIKSAFKSITRRRSSMAWYCSGSTNIELVENLFKVGLIKDEKVKNAMIGVSSPLHPRKYYIHRPSTKPYFPVIHQISHGIIDVWGPRLIGLIMPPQGHTQTRRNLSVTELQSQPRTCMATPASIS